VTAADIQPANEPTDLASRLARAERREAALAGVLRAVAEAGHDLEAVLCEIAFHSAALAGGATASVFVVEGERIAMYNFSAAEGGRRSKGFRDHSDVSALTEVLRDRNVLRFDDQSALGDEYAQSRDAAVLIKIKSSVYVPLPSSAAPLGIFVARREVEPFTDDDVEILQSFAVQAGNAVTAAQQQREVSEALALQTATSEVLRLISEHPGELHVVLDAVLQRIAELCDASIGAFLVGDANGMFKLVATQSLHLPAGYRANGSARSVSVALAIERRTPVRLDDYLAVEHSDAEYTEAARRAGLRSSMAIPLFHNGLLVGVVTVGRTEVRPFSDGDVRIAEAFAEQAVIAISNAKLFNDLDAALERQTASAEIMRVISSSPGDLERTLPEIARTAKRLSNALDIAVTFGNREGFQTWDEHRGFRVEAWAQLTPGTHKIVDDVLATGRPAQLVGSVESWFADNPGPATIAQGDGITDGAILFVPLLGGTGNIGFIIARRDVPVGFSADEIRLLEGFADQAVIALDNAGLFTRLEERNNDLAESLELQTATSEVLALISANPGDLKTVLDGILAKARDLVGAELGTVFLRHGNVMRCEAQLGVDQLLGLEQPFERLAALAVDGMYSIDNQYDPSTSSTPEWRMQGIARGISRCIILGLAVDGELTGAIRLYKSGDPFDDRDGHVLKTFADQAAIAISNSKLFNDLDEALAQQRAMNDVLDAVSTARLDLQPVFDAVARHANHLCGGTGVVIWVRESDCLRLVALAADSDDLRERSQHLLGLSLPIDDTSPSGEAVLTSKAVHIADWTQVPIDTYTNFPGTRDDGSSVLVVPLLRHGIAVGTASFIRFGNRPYADAEISLLQTFANQAAIAVDNARLLREIEERNSDLAESLELQTATSEVLALISANPGDLKTVLDGIVELANRLCEADSSGIWTQNDDDADTFTIVAQSADIWKHMIGRTVPRQAADIFEPLLIDDLGLDASAALGYAPGPAFRSTLVVPLLVEGRVFGAILSSRYQVRPFEPRHGRILQAFADHAVIQRSRRSTGPAARHERRARRR
jgi:GAF domain-containing protein